MVSERHYFTVGLFVVLGFLGIFGFAIWLTHQSEGKYEHYYIRFAESVSGLSKGSVVKFRGVSVGTVDDITIDQHDSRLIKVAISLLKTTPLKTDTKATLKSQGVTGIVFIELIGGDPALPDLVQAKDSDEVAEIPAQQSSINQILDQFPVIMAKLSLTLDQVNKAISDDNIAQLHATLQHANTASGQLSGMLSDSRGSITQASRETAEAMQHLNHAAGSAEAASDQIKHNPSSILFPPDEKGIPAP